MKPGVEVHVAMSLGIALLASVHCSASRTGATPASPASSDGWSCFRALAPAGWRFAGASTSCHESPEECSEVRAEELRHGRHRALHRASREPELRAGEPERGGLDGICTIDPSGCPLAIATDADLTPCRPATEVHCSRHRQDHDGTPIGPTLLSCHETAADCRRFRGLETLHPVPIVTLECVAAR